MNYTNIHKSLTSPHKELTFRFTNLTYGKPVFKEPKPKNYPDMKIFTILSLLCCTFFLTLTAPAQESWPKTATASNGSVVKLYQLQPESFTDNILKAHAAISVLENGKSDPVFGIAWLKANTVTNGDQVQIQSIRISNIKLPGESDDDKLDELKSLLENQSANWNISMPMSELQSDLNLN